MTQSQAFRWCHRSHRLCPAPPGCAGPGGDRSPTRHGCSGPADKNIKEYRAMPVRPGSYYEEDGPSAVDPERSCCTARKSELLCLRCKEQARVSAWMFAALIRSNPGRSSGGLTPSIPEKMGQGPANPNAEDAQCGSRAPTLTAAIIWRNYYHRRRSSDDHGASHASEISDGHDPAAELRPITRCEALTGLLTGARSQMARLHRHDSLPSQRRIARSRFQPLINHGGDTMNSTIHTSPNTWKVLRVRHLPLLWNYEHV